MKYLLGVLWLCTSLSQAAEFRLAAAANLQPVLRALASDFTAQTGHTFQTSLGASGKLYAQISQGAPFDVLMSADLKYPQALIDSGDAIAPLVHYANGVLVLWSTRQTSLPADWQSWIKSPTVRKIALAQPDTAPYGREAMRVLTQQNLLPAVKDKLVLGESIAQTSQFIATGAADVGFSAKSIVANPDQPQAGAWIEIPQSAHQPIAQGAVLCKVGAGNPAAQAFMRYLQTPSARQVLLHYGYLAPSK